MRPLERWFLTGWRAQALAHLPANSCILEVGAGTGLNFRFYPPQTSGVASELSAEMLKIASAKNRPQDICLTQGNAEQLPFRDASFDAALATLTFCAIPSPQRRSRCAVLNPAA